LAELVLAVAVSFALILWFTIVRVMHAVVDETKKSTWLWTGLGITAGAMVVYYLPVRIGTVMFLNGAITSFIIIDMFDLLSKWIEMHRHEKTADKTTI
jgi:hypothetical protein